MSKVAVNKPLETLRRQWAEAQPSLGLVSLLPPGKTFEEVLKVDKAKLFGTARFSAFADILRVQAAEDRGLERHYNDLQTRRDRSLVWITALNNLHKFIARAEAGKTFLWADKLPALKAVAESLEEGIHTGYVKLPTSRGKTVLEVAILSALGVPTLLLVHRNTLLDQHVNEALKVFAPHLSVGRIKGGSWDPKADVLISLYQRLARWSPADLERLGEHRLILADEGHIALGPKAKLAMAHLNKNADIIYLTATPHYNTKKSLRLLGKEIFSETIVEASEAGTVAPFKVIAAMFDIDISKAASACGEYNLKRLGRALNVSAVNNAAVQLYKQLFDGKKILCNVSTIAHADALAQAFRDAGIKATSYSSDKKVSKDERKERLRLFKVGEINVLCQVDTLTAGFNDKNLDGIFNVSPTKSQLKAEQRGGRPLRPNGCWKYIVEFLYKQKTNLATAVLFSEIAGTAEIVVDRADPDKPLIPQQERPRLALQTIPGIEVVVEPKLMMEITRSVSPSERAKVEAQWKSISHVQGMLSGTAEQVLVVAEPYRASNPEWFLASQTKGGQSVERLHIDLANELKKYAPLTRFQRLLGVLKEAGFYSPSEREAIAEYLFEKIPNVQLGKSREWINVDITNPVLDQIERNIDASKQNSNEISPRIMELLAGELEQSLCFEGAPGPLKLVPKTSELALQAAERTVELRKVEIEAIAQELSIAPSWVSEALLSLPEWREVGTEELKAAAIERISKVRQSLPVFEDIGVTLGSEFAPQRWGIRDATEAGNFNFNTREFRSALYGTGTLSPWHMSVQEDAPFLSTSLVSDANGIVREKGSNPFSPKYRLNQASFSMLVYWRGQPPLAKATQLEQLSGYRPGKIESTLREIHYRAWALGLAGKLTYSQTLWHLESPVWPNAESIQEIQHFAPGMLPTKPGCHWITDATDKQALEDENSVHYKLLLARSAGSPIFFVDGVRMPSGMKADSTFSTVTPLGTTLMQILKNNAAFA